MRAESTVSPAPPAASPTWSQDTRRLAIRTLVIVLAGALLIVALLIAPGILGQSVYVLCKLWMLALPLAWWLRGIAFDGDGDRIGKGGRFR